MKILEIILILLSTILLVMAVVIITYDIPNGLRFLSCGIFMYVFNNLLQKLYRLDE